MAVFGGFDGSLYFSDTVGGTVAKVAKVRNWSFTLSTPTTEATAMGDAVSRVVVSGPKAGQGSAELLFYTKENETTGIFVNSILKQAGFKAPGATTTYSTTKCVLELRISNDYAFKFNAFITSVQLGTGLGEVARASINFQMDGDFISDTVSA